MSNWTESDVLAYARARDIPLAPLYFAAPRPVITRKGTYIVVDEPERMRFEPGDAVVEKIVRFRTLGCWPVTGAIESDASDIASVLSETQSAKVSERQGRLGDGEAGESLEEKKREGYF